MAVASAGPYANNVHLSTEFFYRLDAFPDVQPTVLKH